MKEGTRRRSLPDQDDSACGVPRSPNTEFVGARPMYATRPSPLIQPLHVSPFTERTQGKYGTPDLAHEWVGLFQVLGRRDGPHARDRTMCINIPDTIFLSPCGQPSVWYVTSASKHLKTRHTAHVTPRSILSILSSKAREAALRHCAVVRQGFRVRELTEAQLEELCEEMDQARLEVPSEEGDLTGSQRSFESNPTAFCVQAYVERTHHVTFICIWKSDDVPSNTSPKSKPNGDLFLVKRGGSDEDEYDGNDGVEKIHLTRLSLHENDTNTHAALKELGFDVESAVAHLFHMKLWTTEMVSRINRTSDTRQVTSLACEYFIAAHTSQVVFSGLAGIQWSGQKATWDRFQEFDSMSDAIVGTYAHPRSPLRLARSPTRAQPASNDNASLALFYELNPRFPSVQSPRVTEQQWKYRTALLPPHVSPRYIGAEMPKLFRDEQFQPLLTPRQSDAVNRLYFYPQALEARHPLSKKHVDVEKEQWSREQESRSPLVAVSSPRSRPSIQSPSSPRRRQTALREEL